MTTKDPLMAQLPIALAIEPRLLPFAEANGFRMDPKVSHNFFTLPNFSP